MRQSIKAGRVGALNQKYKSKICDDILKVISKELNVKRNIYDSKEAYLNYKNKHFKALEEKNASKFNDYRD